MHTFYHVEFIHSEFIYLINGLRLFIFIELQEKEEEEKTFTNCIDFYITLQPSIKYIT